MCPPRLLPCEVRLLQTETRLLFFLLLRLVETDYDLLQVQRLQLQYMPAIPCHIYIDR